MLITSGLFVCARKWRKTRSKLTIQLCGRWSLDNGFHSPEVGSAGQGRRFRTPLGQYGALLGDAIGCVQSSRWIGSVAVPASAPVDVNRPTNFCSGFSNRKGQHAVNERAFHCVKRALPIECARDLGSAHGESQCPLRFRHVPETPEPTCLQRVIGSRAASQPAGQRPAMVLWGQR